MPSPDRTSTHLRFVAVGLLTLTALAATAPSSFAQSSEPAVFVAHYIPTNADAENYPSIASFTVNPGGTLSFVGIAYTNNWPQTISLSPDGKYLAVAHGTASSTFEDVLIFEVNSDASLEMYAVTLTPDSPLDVCWVRDRILAVTETNSAGDNFVHTYFLDEVIKQLILVDTEFSGDFTSYLAAHPSGNYLYAQDSPLCGSQGIRTFAVDEDGEMTFVSSVTTPLYNLEMMVTSTGDRLYAASGIGNFCGEGDPHRINGFSVSPLDGTLSQLPGSPYFSPGDSPADVAISGDDSFFIAGHGGTGDVHTFFISPEDGFLTHSGFSVDIGGQGDIGKVATLDDLVFVTREFSSTQLGTTAGLLVFRLEDNGVLTPIGDLVNTNGRRPQSLATWKPAPTSRGDIDADGDVDETDLSLFVAVLVGTPLDDAHIERSDLNNDGLADGLDVDPFTFHYLNPEVLGPCCKADFTCSILLEAECLALGGATWLGGQAACDQCPLPPPVITEVFPSSNVLCNNVGTFPVFFQILGSGFSPLVTVVLTSPGLPDVQPFLLDASSSDNIVTAFEMNGVATGIYQIEVHNPDGQSDVSAQTFLVEPCQ